MDGHSEHADVLKLGAQVVGAVNLHHPVASGGVPADGGGDQLRRACFLSDGFAMVATDRRVPGMTCTSSSCVPFVYTIIF